MPDLNLAALAAANARAEEIGPGVAFACEVLRSMADAQPENRGLIESLIAVIRRKEQLI